MEGKLADQAGSKKPDRSFPYVNFPIAFKKQRISLHAVPELPQIVQDLLTAEPAPRLTNRRRELLEQHVGHEVSPRTFDLMRTWVHQFGGKPFLPQGDEWIVCQNERCRSHGKRMKVLAAVRNDPPNGLPLIETMQDVRKSGTGYFNYFVTVFFHFFRSCNSVHAHSQGS